MSPSLKPWLLRALVVAGLAALAIALRGRGPAPAPPAVSPPGLFGGGEAATPEAAVAAFLDAASRGDAEAYLARTTGALRQRLEAARRELGPEGFRAEIQRSTQGVKGHAVTRPADQPAEGVALEVELVFADRNERQRALCLPADGGWRLARLGAADAFQPAIPYGTPVFEE